jgi:hypothetical protein
LKNAVGVINAGPEFRENRDFRNLPCLKVPALREVTQNATFQEVGSAATRINSAVTFHKLACRGLTDSFARDLGMHSATCGRSVGTNGPNWSHRMGPNSFAEANATYSGFKPALASIARNCRCVRMSSACATSFPSGLKTKLCGMPSTWNSPATLRPGSSSIGYFKLAAPT